jgi:paired amphipathic helix protein Sin3a
MPKPVCSGRDELCRETLNDDWISQPEYVSETGFVAHKKTQYEEALHKCEEERYEFDLNIEANLHTIALLEPIYKRIQAMSGEERSKFKLPPGLGGTSKTIYQRVIKKVYDVEKGLEVIEALHENPAVAVPIILKRLKQKDEEWKRCQVSWWR